MNLQHLATLCEHPEEFLQARPAVPHVTLTGVGPELVSIEDVDAMVSSGFMTYPMVDMARDGSKLPPERFIWGGIPAEPGHRNAVAPSRMAREVARGATLIMENLHRTNAAVGAFCQGLSRDLNTFVSASAFMTPAENQGFAHHFDVHDAFIVQTAGSKRWELFAPVLEAPLEQHYFRGVRAYPGLEQRIADSPPDMDLVLQKGDVLFLPRGWIHNCSTASEGSLHVALAVTSKTRYWALRQMLEAGVADPGLRADLSHTRGGESLSAGEVANILDGFAKWAMSHLAELAEMLGEALGEGFPPPHLNVMSTALSLPAKAGDLLEPLGKNMLSVRHTGSGLILTPVGGERLRVPDEIDELIASSLQHGVGVSLDELASRLGPERSRAVAEDMVLSGLFRLARPNSLNGPDPQS